MTRIEPTKGFQILAQGRLQQSERRPIWGILWLISVIGFAFVGWGAGIDLITWFAGAGLLVLVFILLRKLGLQRKTLK